MWKLIAHLILANRVKILLTLLAITLFFGYQATKIQLSYKFARVLPNDDPAQLEYDEFKKLYGEDGNVMVIGFKDSAIFELKKFNNWYTLTEQVKSIKGIQEVLSIARLYTMNRNDSLMKFDFKPVITTKPQTQEELNKIKEQIYNLPFYSNLLYNRQTGATLMAITFDKYNLDSKNRIAIVEQIDSYTQKFATANNIDIHQSGMPYIRTKFMKKVSSEMVLFMLLAVAVTAIILWLFFKSFNPVFFSLIVCIVGVILSVGTLQLFDYKITILTGLIPPLIIVIGVPNCIFLINKYQEELLKQKDKLTALKISIEKVGLSNFLANITTAIGFGVFYFTNSSLLVEFGIVAAINVMSTFLVALVFIPIIFSYLPAPKVKHTKHLQGKRINKVLQVVIHLVTNKRNTIYTVLTVLTLISAYGITKIRLIGHVVDDLPQKDPIYTDLRFFETNFHGVLPFEVNIDAKKPNGIFSDNARVLYKIKTFQREMEKYPEFSKPISAVEVIKFAYQSYKGGDSKYYILPGSLELKQLSDYTSGIKDKEGKMNAFIDSSKRFTRISYSMADIGSIRMKELIAEIKPKVDTIFNYDKESKQWNPDSLKYKVMLSGNSLVFLKGNDYLFHHLFVSLFIAIGLILIIGMVLFRSIAIIVLSKIPCLIPLVMTAGIMGFMDINFKPSTILIFSIAFGIASDGTIYILTEYRNQIKKLKRKGIVTYKVEELMTRTIQETGLSMVYTNTILFFGFAIFAASSFGGTVAMGVLISITLLVSLCTNLVLLPCILISLEKRKRSVPLAHEV
jgi:uncharacterized protein